MNQLTLSAPLQEELKAATPGIQIGAWKNGQLAARLDYGQTYPYYDLASLTKVVFTTTAVMMAHDRGEIRVTDDVNKYLSWFPAGKIRVEQLLAHYSGLTWWLPAYEHIRDQSLLKAPRAEKFEVVRNLLINDQLDPSGKALYSDLDFWMLGFILEAVYQEELPAVWETVRSALGETDLHFCVNNQPVFAREKYAPTEDCPWRKKILQGEVHDDNCWSFGGVSAHAGLFGSIDGLAKWALGLRSAFLGESWAVTEKTVRKFFGQTGPGDWALGFMMPALNNSTAGNLMSRKSIGHLGFTGTSFWYDVENDLLFLALSNRVHPTRNNDLFKGVRGKIHDELFRQLMGA